MGNGSDIIRCSLRTRCFWGNILYCLIELESAHFHSEDCFFSTARNENPSVKWMVMSRHRRGRSTQAVERRTCHYVSFVCGPLADILHARHATNDRLRDNSTASFLHRRPLYICVIAINRTGDSPSVSSPPKSRLSHLSKCARSS